MSKTSKVVVPVDFSTNTNKVAGYALSVADQLGAEVLFLHVVNDYLGHDMMLGHPSFLGMTKDLEMQAKERMTNMVSDYEGREHGVSGKVLLGDAASEIIKYTQSQQADMIIIGTHGVKGLEKILIGSTAEQVAKKADCPVLLFKPFS